MNPILQKTTISKSESQVLIQCDNVDDAQAVFDLLTGADVDNNRIGHACWYRTFVNVRGQWSWTEWRGGRLRAWSTDYQEFDNGPGLFPVAVIEDDKTIRCASIPVAGVSFATDPAA